MSEEVKVGVIKTQDQTGVTHNFELVEVIQFKENNYGLLIPLDENEERIDMTDNEEEQAVILMKLFKDDEGYVFETIEDEAEFNEILAYVEEEGLIENVD